MRSRPLTERATAGSATRRSRESRRGSTLITFLVLVLPITWICGAFAVDTVKVVDAQRRMGVLAETTALAAAAQFSSNPATPTSIDAARANTVGLAAWLMGWNSMFPNGSSIALTGGGVDIAVQSAPRVVRAPANSVHGTGMIVDPANVTVAVDYEIRDLYFFRLASQAAGTSVIDGSIVRRANVCLPGQNPWTVDGTCQRPEQQVTRAPIIGRPPPGQDPCPAGHAQIPNGGCRRGPIPTGPPFGEMSAAQHGPRTIRTTGWAIDPDTGSSIQVRVSVDGAERAARIADLSRPEVAAANEGYGPRHGFSIDVSGIAAGTHQVCVTADDAVVEGVSSNLGCRSVLVRGGSPFGYLDTATQAGPGVRLTGWAIDPDTTAPVTVHFYRDGNVFIGSAVANQSRPDVGTAYPGFGSNHGFAFDAPLPPGQHQVCAYALNAAGAGDNPLLGCRHLTVTSGNPFGSLDRVTTTPGSVRVEGWTIDPDTTASIPIHVYVGSRNVPATANLSRPDVGAVYPGYGSNHGFNVAVTGVPRGQHQVCVYAINSGPGTTHPTLGCAVVNVP